MHVHNIDDREIINSSSNSQNTTIYMKIGGRVVLEKTAEYQSIDTNQGNM